MKEYLEIANDPILWLMCLPVVIVVAVQAIIFSKSISSSKFSRAY